MDATSKQVGVAEGRHAQGADDPNCPLCTHPQRDVLERMYLDCEKVKDIASLAQVKEDVISVHGMALGIQKERLDNTNALYGKMIGAYLNNFDPKKVTAYQAMAAARQKDLINGRVKHDPVPVMPALSWVQPPVPVAGQANNQQVIEGEATEMLPPFAGGEDAEGPDGG